MSSDLNAAFCPADWPPISSRIPAGGGIFASTALTSDITAPSERPVTSDVMVIICCWFSRVKADRASPASKLAIAARGAVVCVVGIATGRAPSRRASVRTASGARTRTAIDRSCKRTCPAGTPSIAPVTAADTWSGLSPTRFASAVLMVIRSSGDISLTPL